MFIYFITGESEGQIIQTISSIGSPAHQISKTFVATTTASSTSSSNTPTNLATGKFYFLLVTSIIEQYKEASSVKSLE